MKKTTKFVCQVCGYQSPKWAGRCPDCGEWASLVEEFVTETKTASKKGSAGVLTPPKPITEISAEGAARTATGIGEFDRVLGGGVVDGSLVLVGGDPGIGKSTILIQAACNLSLGSDNVLYVSGEESAEQIKLRANRLALSSEKLLIAAETDINAIAAHAESVKPKFLFIDSIQTMFDS
ncbi:MAG: AAA family ATPase, partial [Abditibacteriota bacterium]|nr:AAA family ATPase [Abditibacteriota bacterium]